MKKARNSASDGKIVTLDTNVQAGAQSLQRAISVIKTVAHYSDNGVRMSTVARKLDLPSSTVHRILSVLVSEDFIEYDSDAKTYHIGYGIYALGEKAHKYDIREKYQTALKNVSAKTGETTYLVIRSGNDVFCLNRIVGTYPIQVLTFEIGQRRPLGIGAGSLAILSALPEVSRSAIIEANSDKYPDLIDRTKEDIRKMVLKTGRDGYAQSNKLVNPETIGVGVVIKDEKGRVLGAISVAGILSRMKPDRRKTIVEIIRSEIENAG